MLTYYLTSLGVIPYFVARAFVPLFTTALVGRLGSDTALFADAAGVQLLANMPGWATSNSALMILGLLALFEVVTTKIPEIRELISWSDAQVKAAAGFLMCFAIVRGDPIELVEHVEQVGLTTSFASGQSFGYVWSFVIATIVWFAAMMRNSIFAFLREFDEDDDLGIQGFLSWIEDSLGVFGVLFAVVFPMLALLLVGLTLLGLWLTRRHLERKEQLARVPCDHCGAPNALCGIHCPSCRQPRRGVRQVGLMGSIKQTLATDLDQHRLQLLAGKRCGNCGERLKDRRLAQQCQSCEVEPFRDSAAVEAYLASLRATLPRTLAVLLLLSAIPLIGLVPGVIYYRLSLISSLRCYVPRSVGAVARWGIRILSLLLLALQSIPLFGMLMLPLLCLLNFTVYQGLLRRQSRTAFFPMLDPNPGTPQNV